MFFIRKQRDMFNSLKRFFQRCRLPPRRIRNRCIGGGCTEGKVKIRNKNQWAATRKKGFSRSIPVHIHTWYTMIYVYIYNYIYVYILYRYYTYNICIIIDLSRPPSPCRIFPMSEKFSESNSTSLLQMLIKYTVNKYEFWITLNRYNDWIIPSWWPSNPSLI